MNPRIFTIGYEKRSTQDFSKLLLENGVKVLLDVRYRPQSRKRGFSKKTLGALCDSIGVKYVHDRGLGTPPEQLKIARAQGGYSTTLMDKYRTHLVKQIEPLRNARALMETAEICLMCYELDATNCHRKVVAEEITRDTGTEIKHI